MLVCHFVGQEGKPGKSSCSPYRRARLARPAAKYERRRKKKVQCLRAPYGLGTSGARTHLLAGIYLLILLTPGSIWSSGFRSQFVDLIMNANIRIPPKRMETTPRRTPLAIIETKGI